jgi:hypothetical protein
MGLSLVEALAQVDLEAGRVYRCQVNGKSVELRVLDSAGGLPAPCRYDESDVMLDPWVEFPLPSSTIRVRATPGTMPLPDVPEIPVDDDEL